MRKILVAFEGLPGGGKTTISKKLSRYFDGDFVEEIIKNEKFAPTQDEYYIESELLKLKKFSRSYKKIIFFDRSFYSMIAYNYGRKMVGLSHIIKEVEPYLLGTRKPDLFIYLQINDVSLCNKRKRREVNTSDVWTREDALNHIKTYYDNFFAGEPNQITIETDSKSLDEVYSLLIRQIKRYA